MSDGVRKFIVPLLIGAFAFAAKGMADDKNDKNDKPKTEAITTQIDSAVAKEVAMQVMTLQKDDKAGWARAAKTLEGKYGVAALPTLRFAHDVSNDKEFQARCLDSINRIERNVKEGLSGGRTRSQEEKPKDK
jgi:hypothetical protein